MTVLQPVARPREGTCPWSLHLRDGELADAAVAALVAEAELTPKPALVDRRGGGVHHDMTLELLRTSAGALRPTFRDLAAAGRSGLADRTMRSRLADIGRRGETTMLATTGGVNTHRGAIWALGLTVAVAAGHPGCGPAAILAGVARIAAHGDPVGATVAPTPGSIVRSRYRVSGALGEARAGFPHGLSAWHTLTRARAAGHRETHARLDALLASMSGLEDTCLLSRGGPTALARARTGAAQVLTLGGAGSPAGAIGLADLDARLTALGASPGGSADMLALALLLDTIRPIDITIQDTSCRR